MSPSFLICYSVPLFSVCSLQSLAHILFSKDQSPHLSSMYSFSPQLYDYPSISEAKQTDHKAVFHFSLKLLLPLFFDRKLFLKEVCNFFLSMPLSQKQDFHFCFHIIWELLSILFRNQLEHLEKLISFLGFLLIVGLSAIFLSKQLLHFLIPQFSERVCFAPDDIFHHWFKIVQLWLW